MKIIFLVLGKTEEQYLKNGIAIYEKRLGRYIPFEIKEIPSLKGNNGTEEQKIKEGKLILNHPDFISAEYKILLDEKGTQFTSLEFSGFMQKQLNKGFKKIIFVVGGAFGFSEEIYSKSNCKISLSKQTFSHQMVRLFFVEQLYRSFTIQRGEKYHH